MHDRRDDGDGQGRSQRHGGDERSGDCGQERGGDRPDPNGGGADTRFLQLELSQVLYAEAEGVTKQAFRELLVEAAKDRWREHFGDKIVALAHLAVDELMNEMRSNLDIEARIQQHNEARRTRDRVRAIFAEGGSQPKARDEREGGSAAKRGKR